MVVIEARPSGCDSSCANGQIIQSRARHSNGRNPVTDALVGPRYRSLGSKPPRRARTTLKITGPSCFGRDKITSRGR